LQKRTFNELVSFSYFLQLLLKFCIFSGNYSEAKNKLVAHTKLALLYSSTLLYVMKEWKTM